MRALAQCRGTKLIGARKLSRYIRFVLRVMARVRVHILVGFVMGAGFAKTVTNNLPILSVLGGRSFIFVKCHVLFLKRIVQKEYGIR
jgi:hypothetical protein